MAAELAGESLPPLVAARTDGAGRFELVAPAGLWVLQASASGFALDRLIEKQKEGKKRMKRVGRVDIPQEAFLAVLSVD